MVACETIGKLASTDTLHVWPSAYATAPICGVLSGFRWKKASEEEYPVRKKKADVYVLDPAADTAAAIAAAGGGKG